jgi:hypothetical protein
MGEDLEVVWAEFSTLSYAVLQITPKLRTMQMSTSKAENSAQVSSYKLKFVHGLNEADTLKSSSVLIY